MARNICGHAQRKWPYPVPQRVAAHQDEMAPDVQRGVFARQTDRVGESGPVRHQCGSRENPAAVRFNNAGVDVASESEIVGVDDQFFKTAPV
jgi:hypothetical protein